MWSLSWKHSWGVSGFVRVAENGAGIADLRVGIERWPHGVATKLIDAAADPNAADPRDTFVPITTTLSKADGGFELEARSKPGADEVDVLTVRPPARPGVTPRPLFAQLLREAGGGAHATVIDLPVARLLRAGLQVKGGGLTSLPEVGGLLHAARDRERSARRPAQPYSQRYAVQFEAAQGRAQDRISAPRRRGPRLEVRATEPTIVRPSDPEDEKPNPAAALKVAKAIAQLAAPKGTHGARVIVQDPQSGLATVAPPALPLILRRPDATPDPFAQRQLEARWAAARADDAENGDVEDNADS